MWIKRKSVQREYPLILRWRPKKKVFISKNARFSTNSGFYLKNCANFHEFCGEDQNKVKFYEFWSESIKTTKKQFLLTNSRAIISILEVSGLDLHFSTIESVSFFGTQSLLGGYNSCLGGHKQWFGGTRPRNAPSWRRAWKAVLLLKLLLQTVAICLNAIAWVTFFIKIIFLTTRNSFFFNGEQIKNASPAINKTSKHTSSEFKNQKADFYYTVSYITTK